MSSTSSDNRRLEPRDLILADRAAWKVFRELLEAEFTGVDSFKLAADEVFNLFRAIWEYRQDWIRYRENSILVTLDDARSFILRLQFGMFQVTLKEVEACVKEAHEASKIVDTVILGVADRRKLDELTGKIGGHAKNLKAVLCTLDRYGYRSISFTRLHEERAANRL